VGGSRDISSPDAYALHFYPWSSLQRARAAASPCWLWKPPGSAAAISALRMVTANRPSPRSPWVPDARGAGTGSSPPPRTDPGAAARAQRPAWGWLGGPHRGAEPPAPPGPTTRRAAAPGPGGGRGAARAASACPQPRGAGGRSPPAPSNVSPSPGTCGPGTVSRAKTGTAGVAGTSVTPVHPFVLTHHSPRPGAQSGFT